ncbi:MAG: uroporphyrinogen-III C-methyltransferase [Methanotrichaceae archaeon]|nr:uroporphyrinogen-III C-methyltransferase [Methanotrichaceae archaeon]
MAPGKVYLVGAGPGDPELLTLKAKRLLEEADVVLYDRLLSPKILEGLDAELVDVGKAAGDHKMSQDEINRLLVQKAREGSIVVRLKGGDPYVFGRGGEEAIELRRGGIPFEVVPGVTSAISAPSLAGIPVTHRGLSTAVTIVTGHEEAGKERPLNWEALARLGGTLVVLMGLSRLEQNISQLVAGGLSKDTPAAVVEKGGWPDQRLVAGTLADIAGLVREREVVSPAILVVGDVVGLHRELSPVRLAFFRPENLLSETSIIVESMGFTPIPAPSISPEPLPLPDDIARRIDGADCIVFTSPNGVEILLECDDAAARQEMAALLASRRVAAIGPRTARALQDRGIEVSFIPEEYSSAGLVDLLGGRCEKVLLLRSIEGSQELPAGLGAAGMDVDEIPLYRIVGSGDPRLDRLIANSAAVDVFAFTSGSTGRFLIERARELGLEEHLRRSLGRARVAAIGPPTAAELKRLEIRVDLIPESYTFPHLLEAVRDAIWGSK